MVTSKWVRNGKKVGFVAILLIFICLISCQGTLGDIYLNKFAVHVRGGREVAERLAEQYGHRLVAPIGSLEDHYLFEHPRVRRRSVNPHRYHHRKLSEHPQVHWVEQQKLLSRKKRDFQSTSETIKFNDDLWSEMWYFHGGGYNNTDMNVIPAWNKGFSGKNIVVTILDDGIERVHDDLLDNYDPYASYDVNDHDPDPMPRYNPTNENRHGTRCAGEVAAKANNSKCIVGIAFNSKIGGVRMLDGDVFDAVEATSLSFNRSHVDIYSASWGPDDDGRVVDGPGPLALKAFVDGITQGRGGKGSIFVWASGNGGNAKDSCNCDGYTNSIYTLSISSISEEGKKPWYLEECSSTLATTYSSGAYKEKQIISVDLHNLCTETHTGTSASAPLAAGIVALVLEAKPDLTWRDIQYITLMTARPMPDGDWVTNGVGRKVSLRYGYGIMDASAMVDLALKWTIVPEQHICEIPSQIQNSEIQDSGYVETMDTSACDGSQNSIKFLEHVQARIKMKTKRRGDIVLHLTSPMGTKSTILPQRPNDSDRAKGFDKWAFLSVHFWGENPVGRWKLEVEVRHNPNGWDGGSFPGAATTNVLESWSLVLYGTEDNPIKLTSQPRIHPPASTLTPIQSTSSTIQSPKGCHSECKDKCSGPKAYQCDDCKHYKISDSGNCVSNCPPDYFSYNNVCTICPSSCYRCSSVSQSSVICTQCKPGFLLMENRGECVKECQTGYFRDNVKGRCLLCKGACKTCEGSPEKCSQCPLGFQLQDGRCRLPQETCPVSMYKTADGQCNSCPVNCLSCSDDTNCSCCARGSYLRDGVCVSTCGNGYLPFHVNYSNNLVVQQCQHCSGAYCSLCPEGFKYVTGVCIQISNCPEGQYFQWSSMSCKSCSVSCKSCIGPSLSDCLSCFPPDGYNNMMRTCMRCCNQIENPSEHNCCHCLEEGKCTTISQESPVEFKKDLFGAAAIIITLLVLCIASIIIFLVVFAIFNLRKKQPHAGVRNWVDLGKNSKSSQILCSYRNIDCAT
ncbi:hypothetical protein CHS0354_011991 [Potamilus streckersoni]|uniref:P/Homo B domain-containing protein n=1 Tax=Potamilus streckersoni TaxID=2493646 RepID=A0AAE0SBR8_9BIVA|nr:hypothetical protein CHS0354_011991 [Potamilus streckersoni]